MPLLMNVTVGTFFCLRTELWRSVKLASALA